MKRRNVILITIFIVLLILVVLEGGFYYFFKKEGVVVPDKQIIENQGNKPEYPLCLADDEWAIDSWSEFYGPGRGSQKEGRVFVDIRNVNTKETKIKFLIEDVKQNEQALEIHKCGVYVIRNFEIDERKNFYRRNELWQYTLNGKGKVLMSNEEFRPYSFDFRVNDTETYIALIHSWYGDPNHAIVIKDLKTMEDVFVLTIKDLVEIYETKYEGKYAFRPGTFSLGSWRRLGDDILGFEILNDSRPSFQLNTTIWQLEMTSPPFEEYPLPSPATINLQYLKLK